MHQLLLALIIIFCTSCSQLDAATHQKISLEHGLAQAKTTKARYTKHIHKQQRDICNRLKKIQKRIEKKKK